MCEIGEDRDGCETMETNRIRKRLKKERQIVLCGQLLAKNCLSFR